MDHNAFAEVRWIRDNAVGLHFPSPISAAVLAETCRYARFGQ